MGRGDGFLHGGNLGPLDISPVYNLLYSALIRAAGRVGSIFCAQYLVKTFVSLMLFCFLSVHLRSRLLASLLTMIWVVSSVNVLHTEILVNHVALGLFLLALVCIERHRILALLLLCLCVLTRVEYLFLFIALAGYIAWKGARLGAGKRSSTQSDGRVTGITPMEYTLASLLAFVVVYLLLHVSDFTQSGRHAWFTFNQCYALEEVEAGRFHLNPMIDYNLVMKVDFPGATSLREAFEVNPRSFIRHVAGNVPITAKTAISNVAIPYQGAPLLKVMCGVLGGFFVTVFSLASVDGKFTEGLFIAFRNKKTLFYATVMGLLPLIPVQLGYPLPRYVLMIVPFLLFWPGLVCQEALGVINSRRFGRRVLIVLNLLFVLFIAISPKPYSVKNPGRPVLAEISELNQLWPNKRTKLVGIGSSWIADYLGSEKVVPIEPFGAVSYKRMHDVSGNMRTLIERYDPDVVLVNEELVRSPNFDTHTLSALDSKNWHRCKIGSDSFYFKAGEVDTRLPCFSS